MKLTNDDFSTYSMSETMKEQILKNQKDAEKYRNQPEIVTLTLKYREIVERLKKRIGELQPTESGYYVNDEGILKRELQKILGEES